MNTPLDERVDHVIQEARMVLPGTQVLLGMQFQIILMDRFQGLPHPSKLVHLASLFLGVTAIILLETPAAYHRLAEHGNDSERVHDYASRFLLLALGALSLGLTGDVYVVTQQVVGSSQTAAWLSFMLLMATWSAWYAWPVLARVPVPQHTNTERMLWRIFRSH